MINGKKSSGELAGVLALTVLAAIYGFTGFFARELAPGLSIWQQQYLRLILAIPFLWLTFRGRIDLKNCAELIRRETALVVLRSVCLFALSVPLYFYATQHAQLSNVAFLQVLPYTFVLGVLINREKLTSAKLILMIIAAIGACLITIPSGVNLAAIGRGELASIVSGILFSLGFVTRKRHKAKANDYEISFTIMATAFVLLLLFSFLVGDGIPHPATVDARFFILLFIIAYLNTAMILLANFGFRLVRDTLANNIMTLEGVFGMLTGFLAYQEILGAREALGAAIIMLSAIGSAYLASEKTEHPPTPDYSRES